MSFKRVTVTVFVVTIHAVPDDLNCVGTQHRALRTTIRLSHWPAAKRERLLEIKDNRLCTVLKQWGVQR